MYSISFIRPTWTDCDFMWPESILSPSLLGWSKNSPPPFRIPKGSLHAYKSLLEVAIMSHTNQTRNIKHCPIYKTDLSRDLVPSVFTFYMHFPPLTNVLLPPSVRIFLYFVTQRTRKDHCWLPCNALYALLLKKESQIAIITSSHKEHSYYIACSLTEFPLT